MRTGPEGRAAREVGRDFQGEQHKEMGGSEKTGHLVGLQDVRVTPREAGHSLGRRAGGLRGPGLRLSGTEEPHRFYVQLSSAHWPQTTTTSSRPAARVTLQPLTECCPAAKMLAKSSGSSRRSRVPAAPPAAFASSAFNSPSPLSSASFCAIEISDASNVCYLPAANVQALFSFHLKYKISF